MKKYIKPNTDVTTVIFEGNLMAGTGVKTGGTVKGYYNSDDKSYGKENEISTPSLWDEVKLLLGLAAVGRRRQTATKLYATKVATALIKVC